MTPEVKAAIRTTIDYLDQLMEQQPNRQVADASNLLEELLAGEV